MIETYYGWVQKKRKHGKLLFLDMRIPEFAGNNFQVVASESTLGKEKFESLKKVTQESVLKINGEIVENPRAPGGKEMHLLEYEILNLCKNYPLAKKEHSPETLVKLRHLALRGLTYQRMFLLREKVVSLFREAFREFGWHEVFPPILTQSACEGGATLFDLNYFGKKAYLSQSAQLYLEAFIFSLGKVWSLTPSFRAEKSRSPKHLAEFWHLEAEGAFIDFDQILETQEKVIDYVLSNLLTDEKARFMIESLGGNLEYLNSIKIPFERITYDEAVKILSKKTNFQWGEDFGRDEERMLFESIGKPFFVTHYPTEIKAFYVKQCIDNPSLCYSADLIVDIGELTTGGQREDDIAKLVHRIKKEGFDPKDYEWYLDLRKYGSVPHSGFGLGIERFLMWLTNRHIRDTIPFPRSARYSKFI